ncbi:MAG: hypothetical protein WCH39_03040 [Schlesneria sp.]
MNRNRLSLTHLALLTLLMAAAILNAQEPQKDKPAPLRGMISLIVREPVQRELGIENESSELENIRKLLKPLSTVLNQRLNYPTEEDKADRLNAQELYAKVEAEFVVELKKLLKPEQFARLQQIHWQRWGLQAIHDPDLAKQLEITAGQSNKLSAVNLDIEKQRREIRAQGGGDRAAKVQELDAERDRKYTEVLTTEQLAKFEQLKGKPFDLPAPAITATSSNVAVGGPIRTRPGGLMAFALREPILKELGIKNDSPVVHEIRKLSEAHTTELRKELRNINPVIRERVQETEAKLQGQYDLELQKLLTPEQFVRLRQIHWQQLGLQALNDADVAKALAITKDQKEQLAAAELAFFKNARELLNPPDSRPVGPVPPEIQKKMKLARDEQETKVNEILTQVQRNQFAELKGKPFELELLWAPQRRDANQSPDQ